MLPRTHGSGLFTRGQTQVLTSPPSAPTSDEQMLDALGRRRAQALHAPLQLPAVLVGEARPLRGAGRRDIGHGALAERALVPVLPDRRQTSRTPSASSPRRCRSNGSTSMASVCGSTLALMDAGVPIKAPVGRHRDGPDHDDERQVRHPDRHPGRRRRTSATWTSRSPAPREGITALQMDIKVKRPDRTRSWARRWSRPARRGCSSSTRC